MAQSVNARRKTRTRRVRSGRVYIFLSRFFFPLVLFPSFASGMGGGEKSVAKVADDKLWVVVMVRWPGQFRRVFLCG